MTQIEMIPVQSSNVAEIGHDGENLFIRFKNRQLWKYDGVPVELFELLKSGVSVGKTVAARVRGKFKESLAEGQAGALGETKTSSEQADKEFGQPHHGHSRGNSQDNGNGSGDDAQTDIT